MRKMFSMGCTALAITFLTFGLLLAAPLMPPPESEPNNNIGSANILQLDIPWDGQISNATDVDYGVIDLPEGAWFFRVTVPAGITGKPWLQILEQDDKTEVNHICYYPADGSHLVAFKRCAASKTYIRMAYNTSLGGDVQPYSIVFFMDTIDRECDETTQRATVISTSAFDVSGRLPLKKEHDLFKFTAQKGSNFTAAINNPGSPGLVPTLALFKDINAAPIAQAQNNNLMTNLSAGGTYFLRVKYAVDTNALSPYLISGLFTPGDSCQVLTPTIAAQVNGNQVVFTSNISGGTAKKTMWDFGDGTNSLDANPKKTYGKSGSFKINFLVTTNCDSVITVSTTVFIAPTGQIVIGKIEDKVGAKRMIPVMWVGNGAIRPSNFDFGLSINEKVAKLSSTKFVSAKLNVDNVLINTNPSQGYLWGAGYFSAQNTTEIQSGDTLFFIPVEFTGKPGDSTIVDLKTNTRSFDFYIFTTDNAFERLNAPTVSGLVKIFRRIKLVVNTALWNKKPLNNILITVITKDTTVNIRTGADGKTPEFEVPYADTLTVKANTSKKVISGINSLDALTAIRLGIFLPVLGSNQFSFWAGEILPDNKINSADAQKIISYSILLDTTLVTPQIRLLPSEYTPTVQYPAIGSLSHPEWVSLKNPDPNTVNTVEFVAYIKGDLNGDAPVNLTDNSVDDRSAGKWSYEVLTHGKQVKAQLTADAFQKFASGTLHLNFDAKSYNYKGAAFLQAIDEYWMLVSDREKANGVIRLGFLNSSARNFELDDSKPIIELIFEAKHEEEHTFELTIAQDRVSEIYGVSGEAATIALERTHKTGTLSEDDIALVFPNPANNRLHISVPMGTQHIRIELFDVMGRLIFYREADPTAGMEVPVDDLKNGAYTCRIITLSKEHGAVTTIHPVQILH
jgi:PKD repeat protein